MILNNPTEQELLDLVSPIRTNFIEAFLKYVMKQTSKLHKLNKKSSSFSSGRSIDYTGYFIYGKFKAICKRWEYERAYKCYYPRNLFIYTTFQDKDCKTNLVFFPGRAFFPDRPENELFKIYTTHFFCRYRDRELKGNSIEESIEAIINKEIFVSLRVINNRVPYGGDTSRYNAYERFENGICFGYKNVFDRVCCFNTYVSDDMLTEEQKNYLSKEAFNKLINFSSSSDKIACIRHGNDFTEITAEEMDMLTNSELCQIESQILIEQNKERWKRKQMRSIT